MNKSEYRDKRSFAIRLFGIAMLVVSVFNLIIGPANIIHEKKHATEFVTGQVTSVDGKDIKIYYILPGEDEGWLVTMHGSGWVKGDEVRVFYNPNDPGEKYIEGFEESPWSYVRISVAGLALGIAALFISSASKNSDTVNEIIDVFDK